MTDRRQNDRYQLMFHVQAFDADSGELMGQLVDISRAGMLLASEDTLQVGRRYRMRIPLPIAYNGLRELDLWATVAWTAPAMHPAFHKNGMSDLDLPVEQREALDRVIDDYHLRAAE